MSRWPVVGWVWVPLISTTCLPSTSPRVSNAGPGPSDTYGTVTAASSTPNTTIGTSATISVRIRLFTSLRLDGEVRAPRLMPGQFTQSVKPGRASPHDDEYRCEYG